MNKLVQKAIKRGLDLNHRVAETTANGVDWLFRRDTLIKSGHTWFELVHDGDLMAVRYYELPEEDEVKLVDGGKMPIQREQHAVPLVLVPPLGVTTDTFDLMPQRSLVRYMVASGFKVYLVDWGKPKKEHAHLGLKDYSDTMLSAALDKIREHSGSADVSMMGWCLGGLLCLMYQGQKLDKHVRNIVTVASPIDPQSGGGLVGGLAGVAQAMNGPAQLVSSYTNLRLNTLDPSRLSIPPWLTTLGFKMTDPVGSVTSYLDLVTRLSDREFVESYSTTGDYLNNMLRYPGGILKDMAVTITDNQLDEGKVVVGDSIAELDAIESSLLAFAGETDIFVPADIAQRIVDIVASRDTDFRVVPGGHMGVIIGAKAQNVVWAESAEWLASRSGKAKPKAKPKAKAGTKAKAKTKAKTREKARTSVKSRVRPKKQQAG